MDSRIDIPTEDEHDSAYSGLLVNDAHWAFGTDFEDPLAGVDTTIPDGVEAHVLPAAGTSSRDDSLLSHRDLSGVEARIDATYAASRDFLDAELGRP